MLILAIINESGMDNRQHEYMQIQSPALFPIEIGPKPICMNHFYLGRKKKTYTKLPANYKIIREKFIGSGKCN
jgi:hypothetical protein